MTDDFLVFMKMNPQGALNAHKNLLEKNRMMRAALERISTESPHNLDASLVAYETLEAVGYGRDGND